MTTNWNIKCHKCGHLLRDHVFRRCVGGDDCWCGGFLIPPHVAKPAARRVMIPDLAGGGTRSFYGPVHAYVVTRDRQHRPKCVTLRYDGDGTPSSAAAESEPMDVYVRTKFIDREE